MAWPGRAHALIKLTGTKRGAFGRARQPSSQWHPNCMRTVKDDQDNVESQAAGTGMDKGGRRRMQFGARPITNTKPLATQRGRPLGDQLQLGWDA